MHRFPGKPGIYLEYDSDLFNTIGLAFKSKMHSTPVESIHFKAGERISCFAMITDPNQSVAETSALANKLIKQAWSSFQKEMLPIQVKYWVVYVNSSKVKKSFQSDAVLDPCSAGWR